MERDFRKWLDNDDLMTSDWIGEVVNNEDPEFSGRCKVRVYGKFDGSTDPDSETFGIPDSHLPWAYPAGSNFFSGGETQGAGSLSVPKVGAKVKVRFSGGNIYAPEYTAVQDLNQKIIEEIRDSYQNAHVLFYDEDEEVKVVYTVSKGFEIFHKDSHIVINPDSSITIEHQDSKSIIELVGPNINIVCNSTIKLDAPSLIKAESSECVINGTSVTKLGPSPAWSAVKAEPLWTFLKALASTVDAKLPTTQGAMATMAESFEQLSTSKNVKISS